MFEGAPHILVPVTVALKFCFLEALSLKDCVIMLQYSPSINSPRNSGVYITWDRPAPLVLKTPPTEPSGQQADPALKHQHTARLISFFQSLQHSLPPCTNLYHSGVRNYKVVVFFFPPVSYRRCLSLPQSLLQEAQLRVL